MTGITTYIAAMLTVDDKWRDNDNSDNIRLETHDEVDGDLKT